jgi:hypothetical protein
LGKLQQSLLTSQADYLIPYVEMSQNGQLLTLDTQKIINESG